MKGFSSGSLPQKLVERMSPQDRKSIGVRSNAEKSDALASKSEAEIQREVESYLVLLGYERRSPDAILRGIPRSGWFVHLHKAKRNPILLDILILSNTGRYIEIELKTSEGRIRPEQKELIRQRGLLARSSLEAITKIKEWHDGL